MDVGVVVASALIIMSYSVLYRENRAFRIAEAIFVGGSLGQFIAVNYDYVYKTVYLPVAGGSVAWLIPALLGLMFTGFFWRSLRWAYMVPVAVVTGAGLGLALAGSMKIDMVSQVLAIVTLQFQKMSPYEVFTNVIMVVATLTTLFVFFFTKPELKGPFKGIVQAGRFFLMLYIGYQFGNTIMMREAVLIERVSYLLATPEARYVLVVGGLLLIAGIVYDWKKRQ